MEEREEAECGKHYHHHHPHCLGGGRVAVLLWLPQAGHSRGECSISAFVLSCTSEQQVADSWPRVEGQSLPRLSVSLMGVLRQKHSVSIHSPFPYMSALLRLLRALGHHKS